LRLAESAPNRQRGPHQNEKTYISLLIGLTFPGLFFGCKKSEQNNAAAPAAAEKTSDGQSGVAVELKSKWPLGNRMFIAWTSARISPPRFANAATHAPRIFLWARICPIRRERPTRRRPGTGNGILRRRTWI